MNFRSKFRFSTHFLKQKLRVYISLTGRPMTGKEKKGSFEATVSVETNLSHIDNIIIITSYALE